MNLGFLRTKVMLSLRKKFLGLSLFKTHRARLGLDISAHSIKIIELRNTPEGFSLINFAMEEIPSEVRETQGDERIYQIARLIRKMLIEHRIRARRVISVVSEPAVSVRRLALPWVSQERLEAAIRREARDYIPFPLDAAILGFTVIGETTIERERRLEVMVAATREEALREHISIIQQSGLILWGIDALPFALVSAFHGRRTPEGETVALIDIGDQKTAIAVFRGNSLRFAREVSTAGGSITKALATTVNLDKGSLSLSLEDAEAIKREYGLLKGNEVGETEGGIPLSQIQILARPAWERLLTEIQRSLDYYQGELLEGDLDRIILTGGGARLKNIEESLADRLGVEVEIGNPLFGIEIKVPAGEGERLEGLAPSLAPALGAALGSNREINLLPLRLKKRKKIEFLRILGKFFLALLLVVLLFLYGSIYLQSLGYRNLIIIKQAELGRLQPLVDRISQIAEDRKEIAKRKFLYQQLSGGELLWPKILRGMSNLLPDNMLLTSLSLERERRGKGKDSLEITGIVLAEQHSPEATLIEFIAILNRRSYFQEVKLGPTRGVSGHGSGALGFTITCRLGGGGESKQVGK